MKNENSSTTLETTHWHHTKELLAEGDLNGAFTLIGPGSETPLETSALDRVMYVAHGRVTVAVNDTHFMLNPDEVLRVPAGKSRRLRNASASLAKVFTLTLPGPKLVNTLVFPG